MGISDLLLKLNPSGYSRLRWVNFRMKCNYFANCLIPPISYNKREFKKNFGRKLNLNNPTTLNEKLIWLKLKYNINDSFLTTIADKYAIRDYIKNEFGEEYLIPLLYSTTDYRDITYDNMPNCPCIVKANHDSGSYFIIRNKDDVNFKNLREKCRFWLSRNYYKAGKEWQYKNISPRRIIVEKLLETSEGKIPNDYKLHFINGELQFIYVSYDREGSNDRCLYDKDWNKLPFVWVHKSNYRANMNISNVPSPSSLEKMIEFGSKIAERFPYVRVDFYDVDGKLYFGEITLHHGGGMDSFFPDKYDLFYGQKLILPEPKK